MSIALYDGSGRMSGSVNVGKEGGLGVGGGDVDLEIDRVC